VFVRSHFGALWLDVNSYFRVSHCEVLAQNLLIAGLVVAVSALDGCLLQVEFASSTSGKHAVFYNLYVDSLIKISRVSRIVRQQLMQLDPQHHRLQIVSTGVATDPSTFNVDDLQIVKEGGFRHLPDSLGALVLLQFQSYAYLQGGYVPPCQGILP
jgi:hypothetical protein